MKPVARIVSRIAVLADENIDTDRIIPARFLTTTSRVGLGSYCFHDWRCQADGYADPGFPLNRPEAEGCSIVVAGRNFGCGSSREHATWALLDYGIKAVISSEIADIFRNNALKNGLLAVEVGEAEHTRLLAAAGRELAIDVAAQCMHLDDGSEFPFRLEPFARHCLLEGVDQLGYLLRQSAAVDAWEARQERVR